MWCPASANRPHIHALFSLSACLWYNVIQASTCELCTRWAIDAGRPCRLLSLDSIDQYTSLLDGLFTVEHSAVKIWILLQGRSILHGESICSWGYFPFQPGVHNWSIKGLGMCCPVCGKVHIKDPLLFIGKSSLFGDSGFHLKKYAAMIIWSLRHI